MIIRYFHLLVCLLLFLLTQSVSLAETSDEHPLTLLTSHFPPLTYQNDQGEFVGLADIIIHGALAKEQIKFDIKSLPWKRALKTLESSKNHLIYPLSRTLEREEDYLWLAPIFQLRIKTYGLKKDYQNLDITTGKYRFVCIKTTINCDAVKSLNVPEASISVINNISIEQMMKMVTRGYVDFFMSTDTEYQHALEDLGIDSERFIEITQYEYVVTDYLAGKKNMDKNLAERVKKALSGIEMQVK